MRPRPRPGGKSRWERAQDGHRQSEAKQATRFLLFFFRTCGLPTLATCSPGPRPNPFELGPNSVASPNGSRGATIWPIPGQAWSTLVEFGQILADTEAPMPGQIWPNSGHCCPIFWSNRGQVWPIPGQACMAETCRSRAKFGRSRAECRQIRLHIGRNPLKFGRFRANLAELGQFRPKFGRYRSPPLTSFPSL